MTLRTQAIFSLAVTLWALPRIGAQQPTTAVDSAWSDTDVTKARPVLFTISGGISLGSYQSGVNWALVRFVRIARNEPSYRLAKHLPDLKFEAMAGASAGNINALMSAIAWCTERPGESPDSSIFWKTWVYTGWEELYPSDRKEPGGVFDRTYYRTGPLEWLKEQMGKLAYPADCNIPLGMTMTRVQPTRTAVTNNIDASTQRYAALLRVQSSKTDSTRLSFVQPAAKLFHPSLGALASLAVNEGDTIPAPQVLSALMASSAYPVAFADVSLNYIPGTKIANGAACARPGPPMGTICGDWINAQFIDGGLFDNNPLALALGIFRQDDTTRLADGHEVRPSIIYINPDALRDSLRAARAPERDTATTRPGGLASFVSVLKGAIPSARQYELQSMARSLADPATNKKLNPFISTTDRGYPIISEHLGAFAGFLGRPFREYDYYAGVYDALHYVAQHILCAAPRRALTMPGDSLTTCTRKELQAMMTDSTRFGFHRVARAALIDFYVAEFTSPPWYVPDRELAGTDGERIRIHRQLIAANREEFYSHKGCTDGDYLDRMLCSDGFGGIIDRFAQGDTKAIIATWAAAPQCVGPIPGTRMLCLADGTMNELVTAGPREFMGRRMNDIFRQLHSDTTQGPATQSVLGALEYYFRSISDEYSPAFLVDPSTITPYANLAWHAIPYRFSGVIGKAMTGPEFSYLPSLRVFRNLRLIAPAGIAASRAPDALGDAKFHVFLQGGAGFSYKIGKPLAHDISLDWRLAMPVDLLRKPDWDDLGWRAMYQPFGGKLTFGYGKVPRRLAGANGDRRVYSAGIGDLNGLLYYLLRK